MRSHSPETLVHVSDAALQTQLSQARKMLQEARYKQAVSLLDTILEQPLSLMDRLQCLAQRTLAQALWKKTDAAIENASTLLNTVRADTDDLQLAEIDWDLEKSQDLGHLTFLAAVFQLRGLLFRIRQEPRRAVEDFTLAIYMGSEPESLLLNHLHRAAALIELGDCLERALADLEWIQGQRSELLTTWLHLPAEGRFSLRDGKLQYQALQREVTLSADKLRLKIKQLSPTWLHLPQVLNLTEI